MNIAGAAGIVTGAASGLGRATAELLARQGARLVLLDMNDEGLERTRSELPGEHVALHADVCNAQEVKACVDAGAAAFGDLRFVVNCAGVPSAAKTVSRGVAHDLDVWNRVLAINLTGSFNVLRLAAERMIHNHPDADGQRGVIVNTSSIAAFDGLKGQAAYSASKAAIAGMTLPIARDLAEYGIRCMAIAPGVFETELTMNVPQKGMEAMEKGFLYPKRCGLPAEFAAMVQSILANPYVNGTCYRLDGGTRFAP
ncbi:MAG: SDR family NAD(P)-dependent oxidoreductase [Achromobacter sp.]|uniref:SDR family NAD(P)-dependent oxidoreductase n=1 Tax=unclassified Achromobacter TaxID=2626865 RepID=UPI0006FC90FF|nr:SDR family NAD(P)-dependent oxidoreductase [Achromobacter sp. Root565]KRA02140.1 3-hydroxy-2-methylbutyryl-CoA dehydrogenase [Achromobacter sp. Root565]